MSESTSASNFIALDDVVCKILQRGLRRGIDRTYEVQASRYPKCYWLYALCEHAHDRVHLWSLLLLSLARNVLLRNTGM